MAKVKGLGRGLEALLSVAGAGFETKLGTSVIENNQLLELKITQIQPGKYQPRRQFAEDELQELATSIKHNGVIQPIIVRLIAPGKYELIAGERRWRASQLAGLAVIPAWVREFSDEEALAVSLIENIQRKDLNSVEEAQGYQRLIDEFGLTHDALAQITGKSRSSISNSLRLLNLPAEVLAMLMQRQLDMGHARALLPLSSQLQVELAHEILLKKYTTAEVENKVARILHEQKFGPPLSSKQNKDADINRLESALADKLGMVVNIKHNRTGTGRLTISYASIDELEKFLDLFK